MTRKHDTERAIEAANPVDPGSVEQLRLEQAKRELLEGIVAEPTEGVSPGGAAQRLRGRRRLLPRRSRAGYLALGAVASTACALVLLVTGTLVGPAGSPTPALGAALARFADTSPHVLMRIAGWEMQSAKQSSATEGIIEFAADDFTKRVLLGGRIKVETQSIARLEWRTQRPRERIGPPNKAAAYIGTAPALGVTARVYANDSEPALPGGSRRPNDPALSPGPGFTAVWAQSGRRLRFVSTAPDLRLFLHRLSALRFVGRDAWLGALPSDLKLINGHLTGLPLSESLISLRCPNALPPALAAQEPRPLVAFFNRECGLQRGTGSGTPRG